MVNDELVSKVRSPALFLQTLEMRKERSHLKWHFLRGRLQLNGLGLEHFDLIRPWIHRNPRSQRQSSNLVQTIHLQGPCRVRHTMHADKMAAPKIIAEPATQKIGQLRR